MELKLELKIFAWVNGKGRLQEQPEKPRKRAADWQRRNLGFQGSKIQFPHGKSTLKIHLTGLNTMARGSFYVATDWVANED